MKKETYTLTFNRPEDVSVKEMEEYIRDALNHWWGQFEPPNEDNNFTGDPLWGFKIKSLKPVKS